MSNSSSQALIGELEKEFRKQVTDIQDSISTFAFLLEKADVDGGAISAIGTVLYSLCGKAEGDMEAAMKKLFAGISSAECKSTGGSANEEPLGRGRALSRA
jgi:hypothetical protein